jgi:hypothetical protein
MDKRQIRALELEIEQQERFNQTEKKEDFFKERFERSIADQIRRLRQDSETYYRYYTD